MFYYVDIQVDKDKLQNGEGVVLEWTTEPPTQEGWYWGCHVLENNIIMSPVILRVYESNGYHFIFQNGFEQGRVDKVNYLWLGALPVPEIPQK